MRPLLLSLLLAGAASAAEPFLLKPNDVVLFLGDSNTFAGGYVAQIDAVLRTRRPTEKYTLVNLGLPSETCSGLTEKDHPFPRPDVHERLDRALAEVKPTVVFICYGMNDGIYHPFAEDRFKAYQAGVNKLVEKVRAAKARPILLTPPPFDALPVKDKTRPADADDFSYKAPFAGYDGVLRRYADWLMTLRTPDLPVIDVHAAVDRHVQERRKADPAFTFARDGIHPDAAGQALIAQAVLRGLNFPVEEVVTIPPGGGKVELPPVLLPVRLKVDPAAKAGTRYEVVADGQVIATAGAMELAGGIDLTALPRFAPVTRGRQYADAVKKQRGVVDLALLTHVGHKRPQTPQGVAVDAARKQAADMEPAGRDLAAPVTVRFELRPVEPKPGPLPVAHRGLFKHAPENTLPAFGACLELRLGFELDVRRAKDGTLVVLHDETLDRTTTGTGPVAGRTADELRRLDAGGWFHPAWAGTRVPTLAEAFEQVAARAIPGTLVAVDVKVDDDRLAADLVALARKYDVLDKVVFIGLAIESAELRKRLKAAAPQARPARLVARPDDLAAALADDTVDWVYLRWLPSPDQVRPTREKGRRIFVAGPLVAGHDPASWEKFADAAVDAILTDYPLELRQALAGR